MTEHLTDEERPSDIEGQEGSGLLLDGGQTIPVRFHPLAELFPMIQGEAFKALVEDVREHGVRRPIVLLDGMILDGRNRYMAAREVGAAYRVVAFVGDDPVSYVVSENINRRHLTDSQRAMVAAKIAKLPRGDASRFSQSADLPSGDVTIGKAASALNVSERTVKVAKAVVRDGAPELVAAVEAGEVAVTAAAEVAKLPEDVQAEVVAKGPEAVRETAKAIRQDAKVVERIEAGEAVEEAVKPKPAAKPAEPVDPERRKLAKWTTDALIDEVMGLRSAVAEEKSKAARLKAERDDLAARLAEALAQDGGRTIGNLQRQVQTLKGRMAEHQTAAKKWEFRAKKAEARVKELENTPIEMGAL